MFKKSNKKRPQIDKSQLSDEQKEEVGFHINKPLLIVCIVLLVAIIVLSIIVANMNTSAIN